MSGPIAQILAAVSAELAALCQGTLTAEAQDEQVIAAGDDTIRLCFGRRHLPENGTPPRVVFYLGREPAREAMSAEAESESIPRALWTRNPVVTAQCWGRDYDQAEALAQAVAVAFHRAAADQFEYRPLGGEWEVDSGWVTAGEAVYHAYEVTIPVVEPESPTTRLGPPAMTLTIEVPT